MKQLFFLISVLTNVSAFAQKKSAPENHFAGRWQTLSSSKILGEYWVRKSDSLWTGTGYYIKGRDTTVTETIELRVIGKDLFYIPIVKYQNNEEPVRFKMTSSSKGIFVFENPAHDFPKRIVYDFSAKEKLHAYVGGGGRPIHFYYFRVK